MPNDALQAAALPPTMTVAAFYKFVAIDDVTALQSRLHDLCVEKAIKGTILLSSEGINATVSGTVQSIDVLIATLKSDARFAGLTVKLSQSEGYPFGRLKVKAKPEIVTFGIPSANPSVATGALVEPEDWNALISDPDVLVIDTRNDYEVEVGTFARAQNPKTRAFNEFPDYVARELSADKQRRIAMFCTGGIRCEKASAYLINEGFENVYQLHGGILNYLARVPSDESLWRGECFVFDERVALRHGVEQGSHALCERCGHPVRRPETTARPLLCAACAESHA